MPPSSTSPLVSSLSTTASTFEPTYPFLLWIDDEPIRSRKLQGVHVNLVFAHGAPQVEHYLSSPYPWRGVILDHDMPLANGQRIAEEFLVYRNLPVVICTNNDLAGRRMRALLEEYEVPVCFAPVSSWGFARDVAQFLGLLYVDPEAPGGP